MISIVGGDKTGPRCPLGSVHISDPVTLLPKDGGPEMKADVEGMFGDYITAWNAHDVEELASFFTDDCVYENVGRGQTYRGKEELKAWARNACSAFPDFKVELKSLLVAGDRVGFEAVMTGTHTGDMPGLPATGRSFSIRYASIIELHGGKIRRNADHWDSASWMGQLGLMPEAT